MKKAVSVVVLLCAAAACHRSHDPQQTGAPTGAPKVALTPCRLSGTEGEVVCGDFEVYEDRAARTGRKIPLHLMVVKALAAAPDPDPLFILAGGPGQAATEIAEKVMTTFDRVRRKRDLVFVDQRGTGKSNPLECDPDRPDAGLSEQLDDDLNLDAFKKCLDGYQADPRLYTTSIAMDDLDDVRDALGYAKINLWGGSYGTRAALVYLRQHGDHARTATIDGVAPVDLKLPLSFAKDGQRAMELLLDHCEKDASCSKTFPQLRTQFSDLLAKLTREPAHVNVADPLTGISQPVRITRDGFTGILRGLLYIPEAASLMPLTISRAANGDFSPFAAQASLLSGGFQKGMATGMFFSVICAEDAPLVTPEDIEQGTANTFMGASFTRRMLQVCSVWPKGFVPEGYHQPVQSEVPTLLLSGELDPVTPPEHAEAVAKHLSHSKHVIVPGVGHGTSGQGCMPRVINDFIAAGTVEGLDASCAQTLSRPPFFVTFAGPTR